MKYRLLIFEQSGVFYWKPCISPLPPLSSPEIQISCENCRIFEKCCLLLRPYCMIHSLSLPLPVELPVSVFCSVSRVASVSLMLCQ